MVRSSRRTQRKKLVNFLAVLDAEAPSDARFKAALGDDASVQPGKLQELMIHETAVAWIRAGLARTVPARSWEESREAYGSRLKRVCEDINSDNDVEGLCRKFLARIEALVERGGRRLGA